MATTLLQPDVIIGAHPGQLSQFLTAQAGHPAAAQHRQPELLRPDASAPRTQERADVRLAAWCRGRCHGHSLPCAPNRILVLPDLGNAQPCRRIPDRQTLWP
ncbi:hypothetical protein Apa02nite_020530 [Actinoplanes palleronii]|uniref:Uncharacterized protein n=1 Tax=Actinoplanes palleronii TaxID=113570 RepID=A0ABQ4B5M4_9ACTN|nr:hypothetical protein Apa02nite_020530 [Actinoplanes palleronii]